MAIYVYNAIFLILGSECLNVGTYQISFHEILTYLLINSFILKRELPIQKRSIQTMFVSACYFTWQHYRSQLLSRNT